MKPNQKGEESMRSNNNTCFIVSSVPSMSYTRFRIVNLLSKMIGLTVMASFTALIYNLCFMDDTVMRIFVFCCFAFAFIAGASALTLALVSVVEAGRIFIDKGIATVAYLTTMIPLVILLTVRFADVWLNFLIDRANQLIT